MKIDKFAYSLIIILTAWQNQHVESNNEFIIDVFNKYKNVSSLVAVGICWKKYGGVIK